MDISCHMWVWSLELTLYHAVFSIAIPILLVELLFPARRDETWIGRKGMIALSLLLLADAVFANLVLTPYRPPLVPYLLAIAAVVGLFWLARRLPARWGPPRPLSLPRPWKFGLLGFGATLAFFLLNWVVPHFGVPPIVTMLLVAALAGVTLWAVRRLSGKGAWLDEHRLALAWGALMFFILLAPLQELDKTRLEPTTGMALVGLAALVFLIWLRWRLRRRTNAQIGV